MGVVRDLTPELTQEELFQKNVEIRDLLRDRLRSLLRGIKSELESFSWFCSKIYVLEDGEFAIGVFRDQAKLLLESNFDSTDAEFVVRIVDSIESDRIRGGVTFHITARSFEGEILGTMTPPEFGGGIAWLSVTDAVGIEKRMTELGSVDPYKAVLILQKWQKGKFAK